MFPRLLVFNEGLCPNFQHVGDAWISKLRSKGCHLGKEFHHDLVKASCIGLELELSREIPVPYDGSPVLVQIFAELTNNLMRHTRKSNEQMKRHTQPQKGAIRCGSRQVQQHASKTNCTNYTKRCQDLLSKILPKLKKDPAKSSIFMGLQPP